MTLSPWLLWTGFTLFVLAMLALDLGVFHRRAHAVSLREAAAWSAVWVALALLFNAGVWHVRGGGPALEFLTGYLIEKSLSVDNLFVFAMLFSAFAVPAELQHRVLFWGILGALVMRAAFILAGTALLAAFHWVVYLFGAFLVFTGVKMYLLRNHRADVLDSRLLRWLRRHVPVTEGYRGGRFFVREGSRRLATPLFLVLVLVEATDLVFAVDSIPAIFAVTSDPFLVYSSNVFAILGLRSLYFLLAGVLDRFVYLKVGLAAVLVFVGGKMLLVDVVKVPATLSLAVVASILAGSVVASLAHARQRRRLAA